ncbi:hypothetical protein ACFPM3_25590, partial [Streptomyces coeruleoprunus]
VGAAAACRGRAARRLAGRAPLPGAPALGRWEPDAGRRGGGGTRPGRGGARWWMPALGVAAALVWALAGGLGGDFGVLPGGGAGTGGRQVAARDAGTGVGAVVALRERTWGTELAAHVTGVRGPRRCALVVVGVDGSVRPVLGWAVPGGRGGEEPLVEGGTALRPAEIARLEVRTDDGERLLSLRP